MHPTTKQIVYAAGAVALGVLAYQVLFAKSDGSDGFQPTLGGSVATSLKAGAAVGVGGAAAWFLLLLFP